MCGAFAGILASVLPQPADVVKPRLQLYPHKYKGNSDAVVSILKVAYYNSPSLNLLYTDFINSKFLIPKAVL